VIKRLAVFLGNLLQVVANRLGSVTVRVDDSPGWSDVSAGDGPADRPWYELHEDLADALTAWRKNFMVRQVVRLTTAYVVGDGIKVSSSHPWVRGFVEAFQSHRQNKLGDRLAAWCDELTRSGELYVVLFPNPVDGMQYVRAVPASQITRVETDPEDYERETGYLEQIVNQLEPRQWKSKHTARPDEPCLLHYTVNKPVGATRGESDLTPLLPWARRYTDWLRDRVRFNKIRNELACAEIIIDDDSQVGAKRSQYKSDPPTSGSIFVHGRGEELKFPSANIAAFDAEADGKALRLAAATAADVPLHFFSEGDSATRATAVEMGDPTHRHYRMRQQAMCNILVDLCEQAYRRKAALGLARVPADLGITAEAPDISRQDNLAMAQAAKQIVEAFALMADRGWITDELAIRLSFRFAGELLTEDEIKSILEGEDGSGGNQGSGNQDSGDRDSRDDQSALSIALEANGRHLSGWET
jgi:hypothetical protein